MVDRLRGHLPFNNDRTILRAVWEVHFRLNHPFGQFLFWLVFCLFATELMIGTNYVFGQILVTPTALLMVYLVEPSIAGVEMVNERILDTFIGVCLGTIMSLILSSFDERNYLVKHHQSRIKK